MTSIVASVFHESGRDDCLDVSVETEIDPSSHCAFHGHAICVAVVPAAVFLVMNICVGENHCVGRHAALPVIPGTTICSSSWSSSDQTWASRIVSEEMLLLSAAATLIHVQAWVMQETSTRQRDWNHMNGTSSGSVCYEPQKFPTALHCRRLSIPAPGTHFPSVLLSLPARHRQRRLFSESTLAYHLRGLVVVWDSAAAGCEMDAARRAFLEARPCTRMNSGLFSSIFGIEWLQELFWMGPRVLHHYGTLC